MNDGYIYLVSSSLIFEPQSFICASNYEQYKNVQSNNILLLFQACPMTVNVVVEPNFYRVQ